MNKTIEIFMVLMLLVCMATAVAGFMTEKAPICDEVSHHIASGYSYVLTGDYRMNPATPALIRTLIGLPLLFLDLRLPIDHISWQTNDSPVFGHLFLYDYNDFSGRIVFLSRLPVLILSLMAALLIYGWSREIYGARAGMLALFLYAFSPDILGNSGLAMADVGSAFFIMIAVYSFWKFLKRGGLLWIIMAGMTFGFAQSAKHTAVLLVPLYFILIFIYAAKSGDFVKVLINKLIRLIGVFFVGFIALWATYSFEFKPLLQNAPDPAEKIAYINSFIDKIPLPGQAHLKEAAVHFASNVPIPLSSFLISLLGVSNQVISDGQPLFFMGQRYIAGGMKSYYIDLFMMKSSIPLLLIITFSIIASSIKRRTAVKGIINESLLIPIALIVVAVSFSKVQGGIRYLIPAYPFMFIWLSDSINTRLSFRYGKVLKDSFLAVMVLWYALNSISVYPHYMGFFNALVGGPGGYAHAVTHDMDWGQDLKILSEYLKENDMDEVTLSYFGTADPAAYGMNVREFTEKEKMFPSGRVYAVSVRYLNSVNWTRIYEPSAKAGYSIFIFDFRDKGDGSVEKP